MAVETINRLVAQTKATAMDHVQSAASALIQALGETLGVSRVYLFRFHLHGDEVRVSQLREWVAPGIKPEIDNPAMQDATMESMGLARWGDVLFGGGVISGPVSQLPPEEAEFLESQDIKSILVVPVEHDERVWGCMGFDDCEQSREWTSQEAFALRRAAALMAEVITLAEKQND